MTGNPIWFVRADNANRPHPVSPEGWAMLLGLIMACLVAAVTAVVISYVMPELPWLPAAIVIVLGVGDAIAFYFIERLRTDMSITVSEFNSGRTS